MDCDESPSELDSPLARAIRELEKIWEDEPRLGKQRSRLVAQDKVGYSESQCFGEASRTLIV